ncbi:integral membrane protein [Streptomyces sp. W007]|nr:integral membrane protein [Streptomyces sp. W007]
MQRTAARLHEARRLDHDIVEVDASLRQAEESLTLNSRVRQGLLHRVVLRTGLDTLEICAVLCSRRSTGCRPSSTSRSAPNASARS